ncbi:unnamed protein product [Adineta ricciae]|uniref:Uncharacterized protein n=1 Tax=Adineta ricciae TaxID=249248 RepID=A0A814QKK8_ADIRI|nr:unnamed protein product [Adineta ricciae]CAF1339029.1 unnamed protein product [Adineta ricciae]
MFSLFTLAYSLFVLLKLSLPTAANKSHSFCATEACVIGQYEQSIVNAIMVLIICSILWCILMFYICVFTSQQKSRTNATSASVHNSIDSATQNETHADMMFESGQWISRYFQRGQWHRSYLHKIAFDMNQNTFVGYGNDDLGQFRTIGYISLTSSTINMTQTYVRVLHDQKIDLKHELTIELQWNGEQRVFVGKWTSESDGYEGKGSYELTKLQYQIAK